ncbi:hypothetical protein F4824DRAFT_120367 [Ustulina deusta]|nr:hypothetical protein F4824DRAFT_120367 [Ustulina deusta]
MARSRKRKRSASAGEVSTDDSPFKKTTKKGGSQPLNFRLRHPVLSRYYPHVQSLREYIIAQLPPSSRIRRKKISAIGIVNKSHDAPLSDAERSLGALLDTTLVGYSNPTTEEGPNRMDGWKSFSQRGDESYVTLSNGVAGFIESQALVSECRSHHFPIQGLVVEAQLRLREPLTSIRQIVEYVVRTIFNREKSAKWPDHMLCDGFRRNGGLGLRTVRPNPYVEALQQPPWPQLLALLGESGDRIMIDLLLDGAIFVSVDAGTNNVCQISGWLPLYTLGLLTSTYNTTRTPFI